MGCLDKVVTSIFQVHVFLCVVRVWYVCGMCVVCVLCSLCMKWVCGKICSDDVVKNPARQSRLRIAVHSAHMLAMMLTSWSKYV